MALPHPIHGLAASVPSPIEAPSSTPSAGQSDQSTRTKQAGADCGSTLVLAVMAAPPELEGFDGHIWHDLLLTLPVSTGEAAGPRVSIEHTKGPTASANPAPCSFPFASLKTAKLSHDPAPEPGAGQATADLISPPSACKPVKFWVCSKASHYLWHEHCGPGHSSGQGCCPCALQWVPSPGPGAP